ncbi:flagellar basal body-associated FliL family protein [Natronohydrobacter thiooxidans]|jgi:flagellar FliL protein|uniref:flagellar basal body-associated FliL family protein n=1 Tax=Natronohydrobacter thiooxidans TaxID=87172 RepID=UPI0008FF0818|nr:flagellar basal body-associated FliL family protein [Natronohydrobacter thiooxidans]
MSAIETPPQPKKRAFFPLIAGLLGAILLGGGSFYAVFSGLVLGAQPQRQAPPQIDMDFAYIPLENITISLAAPSSGRLLRFSGQIEVAARSESDMARLQPRFLDVVNTYLRAIDPQDLSEPAALIRIRGQILRRLQIVAGEGHIRDFLITEFILN